MKNCVKLLAVLCIGVFAGLLVRGIPISLEVSAGGIDGPAGGQNGDVNGDARLDITDAIFILRHLFAGGEAPVACADSPEIWERVENIEGEVGSLNQALALTARSLEAISYPAKKIRHDRWCANGDGTVTDNLTGLMWQQKTPTADNGDFQGHATWEGARGFTEQINLAGHEDWRLPTGTELRTLLDFPFLFYLDNDVDRGCGSWYWTSQTISQVPGWNEPWELQDKALVMRFTADVEGDCDYPLSFRWVAQVNFFVPDDSGLVLAVRDIGPEE